MILHGYHHRSKKQMDLMICKHIISHDLPSVAETVIIRMKRFTLKGNYRNKECKFEQVYRGL